MSVRSKVVYVACPRCEGKGRFIAWGREALCLACSGKLMVPEKRAEKIRMLMTEGEK